MLGAASEADEMPKVLVGYCHRAAPGQCSFRLNEDVVKSLGLKKGVKVLCST